MEGCGRQGQAHRGGGRFTKHCREEAKHLCLRYADLYRWGERGLTVAPTFTGIVWPSSTKLAVSRTSTGKSVTGGVPTNPPSARSGGDARRLGKEVVISPDAGRASDRKRRSPPRTITSSEVSAEKRRRLTTVNSSAALTGLAFPELRAMYEDSPSAAQLFARIVHPSIPGTIVRGETFTKMSFRAMRFLAYVNKIGHEFEAEVDDDRRRAVQAKRTTSDVQVRLDDALKELDLVAKKQGEMEAEKASFLAKVESARDEVRVVEAVLGK